MKGQTGFRIWLQAILLFLVVLGLAALSSCALSPNLAPVDAIETSVPATQTVASTATPLPTGTGTPVPTETSTPKPTWTPFKTSLEDYRMSYDPKATPDIPPSKSITFRIWGDKIPARPYLALPEIILSTPPAGLEQGPFGLLEEAGCKLNEYQQIECGPDTPLAGFACDEFQELGKMYLQQTADLAFVSECKNRTETWENAQKSMILLTGCAFRYNIGYVFKRGEEYILAKTLEEMKKLYAPIDSAAEAITYAQFATGLYANFNPVYDPAQLYLASRIQGTQVTETAGGYEMNLFHSHWCSCEPWITSEVIIGVSRAGEVTWKSAVPISMTTGFSCAD